MENYIGLIAMGFLIAFGVYIWIGLEKFIRKIQRNKSNKKENVGLTDRQYSEISDLIKFHLEEFENRFKLKKIKTK